MHYTRIYPDEHGNSRFERVTVPLLDQGIAGALSVPFDTQTLVFRENKADYNWDFHNIPSRRFIVLLDGEIEITTSLGQVRRFSGGDILLLEDTTGFGHKTEQTIQCISKSLFIIL